MTGAGSEGRFERAMEKLFLLANLATPAASAAGPTTTSPTPAQALTPWMAGPRRSAAAVSRTDASANVDVAPGSPTSAAPQCRPWDRGDLLRRLGTFKSSTWFGKPQVAGPVACARRGWTNVDSDLLMCEVCQTRISFVVPPTWPRQQVERAAESFSQQLETGHKDLCAWQGNACPEALAHFPPTPPSELFAGYKKRCEALLQLLSLPVVTSSALIKMRATRGPQLARLLAQPPPQASMETDVGLLRQGGDIGGAASVAVGEASLGGMQGSVNGCTGPGTLPLDSFFESQRVIAICGWEPLALPYTVDCEERSVTLNKAGALVKRVDVSAGTSAEKNGPKNQSNGIQADAGQCGGQASPKVRSPSKVAVSNLRTLWETVSQVAGREEGVGTHNLGPAGGPSSVVLECNLCGARVGLWNMTMVRRPVFLNRVHNYQLAVSHAVSTAIPAEQNSTVPVGGVSAASEVGEWWCRDRDRQGEVETVGNRHGDGEELGPAGTGKNFSTAAVSAAQLSRAAAQQGIGPTTSTGVTGGDGAATGDGFSVPVLIKPGGVGGGGALGSGAQNRRGGIGASATAGSSFRADYSEWGGYVPSFESRGPNDDGIFGGMVSTLDMPDSRGPRHPTNSAEGMVVECGGDEGDEDADDAEVDGGAFGNVGREEGAKDDEKGSRKRGHEAEDGVGGVRAGSWGRNSACLGAGEAKGTRLSAEADSDDYVDVDDHKVKRRRSLHEGGEGGRLEEGNLRTSSVLHRHQIRDLPRSSSVNAMADCEVPENSTESVRFMPRQNSDLRDTAGIGERAGDDGEHHGVVVEAAEQDSGKCEREGEGEHAERGGQPARDWERVQSPDGDVGSRSELLGAGEGIGGRAEGERDGDIVDGAASRMDEGGYEVRGTTDAVVDTGTDGGAAGGSVGMADMHGSVGLGGSGEGATGVDMDPQAMGSDGVDDRRRRALLGDQNVGVGASVCTKGVTSGEEQEHGGTHGAEMAGSLVMATHRNEGPRAGIDPEAVAHLQGRSVVGGSHGGDAHGLGSDGEDQNVNEGRAHRGDESAGGDGDASVLDGKRSAIGDNGITDADAAGDHVCEGKGKEVKSTVHGGSCGSRENDRVSQGEGRGQGGDEETQWGRTSDTANAQVVRSTADDGEATDGVQGAVGAVCTYSDVDRHNDRPMEVEMRRTIPWAAEFDPLHSHRHFCPWISPNTPIAGPSGNGSGSAICGWQHCLDVVDAETGVDGADHPAGASRVFREDESTTSALKGDALASVRRILQSVLQRRKPTDH
ncbi:hypothetical protein CBR_g34932 [Chara braunii]|uniref:C3HC-type domain-containing protein n=1 Tax=Chara braunii TaxID=69332 RepID=A0A388LJZ4_CHABU|nr:hypothetical protein CBR_g34932 [Chara braunii]|eukprot:GBG82555.1 hypothetical protein CBR_g34932 [Chara braunii]